jgi:hypothetical protein
MYIVHIMFFVLIVKIPKQIIQICICGKKTYILLYVSHRYLYTITLGSLKLGNILERKTYII